MKFYLGLYCLFPDFRSSKRAEWTVGRDCAFDFKWRTFPYTFDVPFHTTQVRQEGREGRVLDLRAFVPGGWRATWHSADCRCLLDGCFLFPDLVGRVRRSSFLACRQAIRAYRNIRNIFQLPRCVGYPDAWCRLAGLTGFTNLWRLRCRWCRAAHGLGFSE